MPTVLRQGAYRLMIYTRDHEPMHVHVWSGGGRAIIEFEDDLVIREVCGLSRSEVRDAFLIVEDNRAYLTAKWREIYGKSDF